MIQGDVKMYLIGICGASGSGKSTLANELINRIGIDNCYVLQQDAYYIDHSDISFEQRCLLNYDKPDMFDHDLLLEDMTELMEGRPVTRKRYDFTRHCRDDNPDELVFPRKVMIIEGIHSFYDQRLLDKMNMKLYINVEPDICLLRRIHRDIKERGRDIDEISKRYLDDVKPMFDKYIRNYIRHADVIVAGGGENTAIADMIVGYVKDSVLL